MNSRKPRYTLFLSSLIFIGLLIGCKSAQQWQLHPETPVQVELGAIVQREGILKNSAEIKTIPQLSQKLRVSITPRTQAKKNIKGDTSKAQQETLIEIELIDDIRYAAIVNSHALLRDYIKNSKRAAAVTRIRVSGITMQSFEDADAYFMEDTGQHNYMLTTYKEGTLQNSIPFTLLEIVDYQVSYFCFGKDELGRINIMDLAEEGKSCKRPLEEKVKNLTKTKRLHTY